MNIIYLLYEYNILLLYEYIILLLCELLYENITNVDTNLITSTIAL